MYEADADVLVELADVPQSSVGAPLPHITASEQRLVLAYLIEAVDESWDGSTVRVVRDTSPEPVAQIEFDRPYASMLGPPNDEALAGHPLADRGLEPYTAYAVNRSSWLAELRRRNEVHPYHQPDAFDELRHLIFVFHDSTFECLARGYTATVRDGPIKAVVLSHLE